MNAPDTPAIIGLSEVSATAEEPIEKFAQIHRWDLSVQEAQALQAHLATRVSLSNEVPEQPRYVVGTDISGPDARGIARGSAVVLRLPDLSVVEVKCVLGKPGFPYVPGLLSFREAPLVLGALERLTIVPDLLLVDGQGLAHPRRFGLACHLGLLTGLPTIGCAKSILAGRHGALGQTRGSSALMEDKGQVVGAALRSRDSVTPVYVSVGHKVDLESALRWALACCKRYRIPEPTRLAHLAAAGRLEEIEPPSVQATAQPLTGRAD